MKKLNIGVIFGGFSSEHEISKKSAITILSNICKEKYNVIPIYIDKSGNWFLYDGNIKNIENLNWSKFGSSVTLSLDKNKKSFIRIIGEKIKYIPVDVIFPVLHGKNGEDGTIQGLFEMASIPYVGCGVLSSSLCMDKLYTKILVNSIGIKQVKYLSFDNLDLEDINLVCKKIRYKIGYPCFVKPARSGSSIGISKASNKKELIESINKAVKEDNKIIVEKCINMRELECAILGDKNNLIVSSVGEIKCDKNFYSFDSKYNNSEPTTIVPADIEKSIELSIKEKAVKIFNILDCYGLSRVDFFYDLDKKEIIFNEINTMPGFTDISMYPMLFRNIGLSVQNVIDQLIQLAIK